MNKIFYTSKAEWLDLRLDDITSTESAALFGLSPYITEFELWHRKKSRQQVVMEDTKRMKWGRRLESPVAEGIAEDLNIKVIPAAHYGRHSDCPGMGSSFDYEIMNHPRGPGLMEIKCVDSRRVKAWEEDEAPVHIETQVQHQMEVAGVEWCIIAAFFGGNDDRIIYRDRDHEVGRILRERITAFWQSIKDGKPPEINYERDAEYVIQLHQSANVNILEAGEELKRFIREYKEISEVLKLASDDREIIKAKILEMVGEAYNKVLAEDYTLSCGMTKSTPPTLITQKMVGQFYGGRKSYRDFRVSMKNEEK